MRRRTDNGELLHAILLMLLGIFFFIVVFCVSGCVSAPVAPNLKWPEPKECPKVEPAKTESSSMVPSCPKVDMPSIPKQVFLKIEGNDVEADAGGELLLRAYVRARKALK